MTTSAPAHSSSASSLAEGAACTLCAGPMQLRFEARCDHRRPAEPEAYSVYWCEPCGYGSVLPLPTPEQVRSYYELEAYYTHADADQNWQYLRRGLWDRVREHLAWRLDRGAELDIAALTPKGRNGSAPRLCEIGCGAGGDLVRFRRLGWDVLGVEPDPAARRSAAAQGVPVFAGTLEDLPEAALGQRFDLIWLSHVLEHCLDLHRGLDNLVGMLAPGGRLAIEVPNCDALGFSTEAEAWHWTDVPRHLHHFTARSLTSLLEQHGLAVVEVAYRGYCRQFSKEWLEAERAARAQLGPARHALARLPVPIKAWLQLAWSASLPRQRKYDSVRLLAEPRAGFELQPRPRPVQPREQALRGERSAQGLK